MEVKIDESWKEILQAEFDKPYFKELVAFVKNEYKTHRVFPPAQLIFNAFDSCPFDKVKVVLLGQDPYHGVGQAHGLCFSVNENIALPPSLINIYKEISDDLGITPLQSGNLIRWANQGVLLLNATLTVRANKPGSHQNKGWEQFTDAVIQAISDKKEGVVFLLWGNYAKQKGAKIDRTKHLVLESGHPSPMSANKGYWFGNKHFSKTNNYLTNKNLSPIDWQ
ncbi:uracil-DNA glycosylase [Porphyromonadaceae bacterium COT-184 OH4590]|nr:uracil-DNA glycosylase [Porphyromonadaceae bacterium COT-184 OH4590]